MHYSWNMEKRAKKGRDSKLTTIKTHPKFKEDLSESFSCFLEDIINTFHTRLAQFDAETEELKRRMRREFELQRLKVPPEFARRSVSDVLQDTTLMKTKKLSTSVPSIFPMPTVSASLRATRSRSALCNKFKTPASQMLQPANTLITPKVNMNAPLTVMRRPRLGELAVSMTGSPLLVSSIPMETTVNVNIPLEDGSMVALLPQPGFRTSDFPAEQLPQHTREQLEAVYNNLDILLHNK